MSAQNQTLGSIGGDQGTASGSVDGAGGPAPTGTQAVDKAADTSVQPADSSAVDDGAGANPPEPVDPSIPPASGIDLFSRLPNEVLHHIIVQSDPIARHGVMLTCKRLRPFGQGVDGEAAPTLSQAEYIQFQRQLEAHSSRKLRHLYCPSCDTFKKPTPSKTTFTDAHAVQNYSGRRTCVDCGIASGYYDRRDVVIKKQKLFLCGGCKLLWGHEKEEKAITDAVFTKGFPWHSNNWGQGAEITIGSGRKRWCKPCRAVIANLGDSGAVKVKPVRMP